MENTGVTRWLISCDESGVHGSAYYGFGSLWMKWQRRGDYAEHIREIRQRHKFSSEIKWNKVQSMRKVSFYRDLIEYFFKRKWLVFHCLVVKKEAVRKELHKNNWDLARRKHYTMLLTNKMKETIRRFPDRQPEFRIHIDPIASSYSKADEAMEVISNNTLNQKFSELSPVTSVLTKDSKESPAIQLCDLFLGAIMETWQKCAERPAKQAVRQSIAEHLGWPTLDSDTHPKERKFNIWYFLDTTREKRQVVTRPIKLKYPYP